MSTTMPPSVNTQFAAAVNMSLQQPAFIVGAVRSGTTLLRLMLDHHPQLAFHFEFEFAVDQMGDDGSRPAMPAYHDYLSRHRIFLLSGATIDPNLDYDQLVNSFLDQKRLRDGKPLVGATVHNHFDRIPHLWLKARYIHLLRDGRDVARSCIAMGWAGNMFHAVERWIEAETSWQYLRQQIPASRQLEIRYEDLIANPRNSLTTICEFLEVSYDDSVFDYVQDSTYDLPNAKLVEQWRNKLSDYDIQLAESRIGEMLVDRGYQLSGLPRLEISARHHRQLTRQDWHYRAAFRMKRYGLPLFTTDYLARKLQLKPLANWCQARVNQIDNRHLR